MDVAKFLQATLAAGAEVREAAEWRERVLKAEAQLAARVFDAKKIASVAPVVEDSFLGAAFDRAAGQMAAESAQMLAAAERSVAPTPLADLSREAFSLSNKIQQPVDLTAQLLVLAELRGLRSDLRRSEAARQLSVG